MKDKLVKAYRTAWRWPELFTHDPAIIWISRATVFIIPLGLAFLTLLTGIKVAGFAIALGAAALVTLFLIWLTVEMFYAEYESVKDFQTREARIKEYFHGFPKYTAMPLIEYEKDEWISYGHVDPTEFLDAIQTVILEATGDSDEMIRYIGLKGSVGHLYATFRNEGHWDEGLELCKASTEDCFPITRVTI